MKAIGISLFFCGLLLSADDGYLVVHVSPAGPKDKHWKFGSADVNAKGTLPRGADVSGPAGGDLILKCSPTRYYSYSCAKDCTVPVCQEHVENVAVHPIDLHQHTEGKTGLLEGLFTALFVRTPVLPVVAASRAGGNPNDAVVLQRGDEIHLGPALRRVVEDTYCFQLKRLPSSGEIRNFSLAWDRSADAEGIAKLPNLKPGAYELAKGSPGANGACRLDEDGLPAWVVLAPESEFARANADWNGYREPLAELEKSGAAPSLLLAVRRAALSGIADSVEGR
jgi:hypothetical protein